MNTKVVGGLLAVLFVTSMVQTLAILEMQDKNVASTSGVNQQISINRASYNQNQTAAVGYGTIIVDPAEPGSEGYTYSLSTFYPDGTCETTVYDGATDEPLGTLQGNWNPNPQTWPHCVLMSAIPGPNGDPTPIIIDTNNNTLHVNSESSILAMQTKLIFLGYLTEVNLTGKTDVATQAALKSFQKIHGISQTGTYGPQTKAALDKIISSAKGSPITGTSFTFSK